MATIAGVWGAQSGAGLGLNLPVPFPASSEQNSIAAPTSNENPSLPPDLAQDRKALLQYLVRTVDEQYQEVIADAAEIQDIKKKLTALERSVIDESARSGGGGGGGEGIIGERLEGQKKEIKNLAKEVESTSCCMKFLKILAFIVLAILAIGILL